MKGGIIYLAVPYSHPTAGVRQYRFEQANYVAGMLMQRGEMVFSPISQNHPIAKVAELPSDWAFWEEYDKRILAACDRLYILCIEGWVASVGVSAELALARNLGLQVRYITQWNPKANILTITEGLH